VAVARIEERSADFRARASSLRREIAKVIVGHERVTEEILVAMLSSGHVLIEGVPGLGKTLLVRTISAALDLHFRRVQFTPDLMPADITGTRIATEDESGRRRFVFQEGPLFANVVLADEINRATPKTQAALLEAMQEHSVTVAGETHPLPAPFFVLATQNPIEMEGTYPLPEAELDRFFFHIHVETGDLEHLVAVIERTTGTEAAKVVKVAGSSDVLAMQALVREVPAAEVVKRYAARLVLATHPRSSVASEAARRFVRYGASPRAAQALILAGKAMALLAGRYNVAIEDVRRASLPALRHRVLRNFEAEAEGVTQDEIVGRVMAEVDGAGRTS